MRRFLLLLAVGITSVWGTVQSNSALFERYSKLKLLSDCLGDVTIARWRQQLITASKKCEQNPPFIPALLHQYPSITFKQPPHYFVPNVPPQIQLQQPQHQYVTQPQNQFIFPPQVQQQLQQKLKGQFQSNQPLSFRPIVLQPNSQGYKTYFYYKQPPVFFRSNPVPSTYAMGKYYVSPGVSQTTVYKSPKTMSSEENSSEEVAPHTNTQGATEVVQSQGNQYDRILGNKKYAGQKESYTNPNLKYEDTEQYLQEQQELRAAEFNPVPVMTHKVPITPTGHYIPASRIQKREAEPGWLNGNNNRGDDPSKSEKLRTMLRSRVSDRVSNMTCVMKALKMLDENLEPNYQFLEDSLLELPVTNDLYDDLKSGIDHCKVSSSCRSSGRPMLHDIPINTDFSASLEFFRCVGKERLRSCMKSNVEGMMKLLEKEQIVDPFSGFYGPESSVSTAVGELEDLLTGNTGHFVDLLLI